MRYFLFLFIFSFYSNLSAQTTDSYQSDLIELRNKLEKTPSFKTQIREQSLELYNQLFNELMKDSSHKNSTFNYFRNLSKLFYPIKDNHLAFYQIAKFPNLKQLDKFNGNIDSLKEILEKKNVDSVEGIYYAKNHKIGVFKDGDSNYLGVAIEANGKSISKGDIIIYLYQVSPNYFKAVYSYGELNYFILYQNEKYLNQSLINTRLSKNSKIFEPNKSANKKGEFELCNLSEDIQYLRIRNFNAEINKMKESQLFFDSIKNSLVSPNLILDLSINYGGAEKVSKKYLKLLRNYTKSNRLFVLVGNNTISHGEIFALQLKGLKNTIILGQTTQGQLAYGSNTDIFFMFGDNKLKGYFTDMNDGKDLLKYETVGISPEQYLQMDKDWIEQVIEIIRKK